MRYLLNTEQLQTLLTQRGYENFSHFASATGLNRATLHNFLHGQSPISKAFYDLAQALAVDPLTLLTPANDLGIQYAEEILPIIRTLVKRHPSFAIGLLGSRAKGHAKKYADWDLGITGGFKRISTEDYLKLTSALGDLVEDLPRMVDFMNLDDAPVWFMANIDYTPIFLDGNKTSWAYWMGVLHGIHKDSGTSKGLESTR